MTRIHSSIQDFFLLEELPSVGCKLNDQVTSSDTVTLLHEHALNSATDRGSDRRLHLGSTTRQKTPHKQQTFIVSPSWRS
jgi:hypothetical protein